MFLLNGNRLAEGISFYDANGTQYPPQWLNVSTEEQKAAIGITWVADAVRADDRFYWDGDVNNPKALEMETDLGKMYSEFASDLVSEDFMTLTKIQEFIKIQTEAIGFYGDICSAGEGLSKEKFQQLML